MLTLFRLVCMCNHWVRQWVARAVPAARCCILAVSHACVDCAWVCCPAQIDINQGTIWLDGVNTAAIGLDALRQQVGPRDVAAHELQAAAG
jgi:hypothetical protein